MIIVCGQSPKTSRTSPVVNLQDSSVTSIHFAFFGNQFVTFAFSS